MSFLYKLMYILLIIGILWLIFLLHDSHFFKNPKISEFHPFRPKFQEPLDIGELEFQKVADKFWVYSAYHDYNSNSESGPDSIYVLGIYPNIKFKNNTESAEYSKYFENNLPHCKIIFEDQKDFLEIPGTLKYLDNDENELSGVFIECPIPQKFSGKVYLFNSVSIIPSISLEYFQEPVNSLEIQFNPKILSKINTTPYRMKFRLSICTPPSVNFDNDLNFIEFIEMYKILGVEHFTFYNHSFGPKITYWVREIYSYHEDQFKIIDWNDEILNSDFSGQVLAQTDCLYRHKGVSEFVMFVDFDEFIMPRIENLDLIDLLQSPMLYNELKPEEIAEFRFQNVYYVKPSAEDVASRGPRRPGKLINDKYEIISRGMKIITWTMNQDPTPWEEKNSTEMYKTKFIVRPEYVKYIQLHRPNQIMGDSIGVSNMICFLHHYKEIDKSDKDGLEHMELIQNRQNFTDTFPRDNYGRKLMEAVYPILVISNE